jgi:hypothetical protein
MGRASLSNRRKKTTSGELVVRGMTNNDPRHPLAQEMGVRPKITRTFLLILNSVHALAGVKLFTFAHCRG